MNGQDPLAKLRDIRLPATDGWWPPAPGWWLLGTFFLIAVSTLLWLWFRNRQKQRWKRAARHELEQLEQSANASAAWFTGLNTLLKRVARQRYPNRQPQALTGQQWVDFLLETAPGHRIASRPVVEAMVASAWQPRPSAETGPALAFAREWLEAQS
ncbi:DUF4381 domain-containing protein [Marinobacter sp. VGCF2001]|uniref:DUF4381 domain-containing protein n=1 Tax=Marinobacter sp. VGCF2001 TaxID=3417189 RepID=UPI003CEDBE56